MMSIACLVLGLLLGTTIISSLSALMLEFQATSTERNQQLRAVQRYVRDSWVQPRTAYLVEKQLKERLWQVETRNMATLPCLELLSSKLRLELHFERCAPFLLSYGLFEMWTYISAAATRRFCMEAVQFQVLLPEDDLFLAATPASASYLLLNGGLRYMQVPGSSYVHETKEAIVDKPHSLLCEAALWSKWVHVGKAVATTLCKVLAVSVNILGQAVATDPVMQALTLEYGKRFHAKIIVAMPPREEWPTDLHVPASSFEELIT